MNEKSLKEKMIAESYKIINDEGFDNFSIRILSKRLDVSHNAMYKHFSSKADLLLEVVKLGFNTLTSEFFKIQEQTDIDELTKFKGFLLVYIEFAIKNADIYRLMYNFEFINNKFPDDLINTYKINYTTAEETVQNAIKTGKLKDASVYTITNTAWAFAHGMALLLVDNILPKAKDLDSPPQLMNNEKNNIEAPIRDVVKQSIDILFDGLIAKKKSFFS